MPYCPTCRKFEDGEAHTDSQPLLPVHRSYPITLRVNPPRSFGQAFGATVGIALGLAVATWLFSPRR